MKKVIAMLIALCTVFLCACGTTTATANNAEYANQNDFLKDMAEGISLRLKYNDDSSQMSAEERSAFYLKLVGYELGKIEKYQDAVFEDEDFNSLAHMYIEACKIQRYAAQNYKNEALHDSLWSGGLTTREGVITELYTRYSLPITSEQAAVYSASSESPSYTLTITPSGTDDETDYTDCVSVEGTLMWGDRYGINYHYDLVITNEKADCDLDVTATAVFYDDKGNVVGSDSETIYALGKGETQFCELRTDVQFSKAEYKIERAENSIYESMLSDLTFNVTTPNNKVMVEATNTGEDDIEWGKVICIFYNGKNVVDYDNDYFATMDNPIEQGEVQYAECSTKVAYTSYKLYYVAYN